MKKVIVYIIAAILLIAPIVTMTVLPIVTSAEDIGITTDNRQPEAIEQETIKTEEKKPRHTVPAPVNPAPESPVAPEETKTPTPVAPVMPRPQQESEYPMPQVTRDPAADDFTMNANQSHIIPAKGGEIRTIKAGYVCIEANGCTMELVPDMIIVETDTDEMTNCDWVYCEEEWSEIKLSEGEIHNYNFEITPPENAPKGDYTFTYTVVITPNDLGEPDYYEVSIEVTIN